MAQKTADDATTGGAGSPITRWLIIAGIVIVAALILSALIPRTWAQIIGDMIDGNIALGSTVGVVAGFIFTALPLAALWGAWHVRESKGWSITLLIVALVSALPNLMTLWIVLGTGSSAHAGERILDVNGPGFRGGTAIGAAAAGVIAAIILTRSLVAEHRRRKIQQEKDRQRAVISDLADEAERERGA